MRNLRSVCLAVISLLLPALAAASDEVPQVGKAAPQLTLSKVLQAPAGADVKWNALRGKVVVIDFWATWCAPCRESIPHWNQLVDAFADKPVRFVAITDENDQVVREFLKRTPIHGWIGLGGVGRSTHDAYGVEGIPATFIINQKGVVVAATHPAHLEAKHIREVLETGTSSLTTPAAGVTGDHAGKEIVERVPASRPVFELSVARSGPLPHGHGTDCWSGSAGGGEVTGQYASVQGAILTLFGGRQLLLDCRTPLPDGLYEFVARTPPAATPAERERAVSSMFRSAFGLQVRRGEAEREVYVLAVASDGAGLAPATTRPTAVGSDQPGALRLRSTTIDALLPHLETWLHKPVVNETGLKGQYDIAFKWKMSKREMLPYTMDQQVLALAVEPDLLKERAVSSSKRRQLAAIRGGPSDADFKALAPEDRENVELLRSELAKPDEERCQPEPAAIVAAVRQYLGLSLTPRRRSVPVLIVERANPDR